ncbi:MAG TPA: anti-sigma factor domain-containing protein [Clostridia bacterium]|nr:anti-sigma factor domain-containing protein [Clostridia bacterium]
MKGIVAQVEGKYAIVLAQDGSFRKVRAKPFMETGIEIDMDQPAKKVRKTGYIMKAASIAAAALLALGTAYGAYSYAMPYSYVHLDINPSIELTANVYDRIIKVEALNEDGRKLLDGRNLKHSRLEIGVSDLLDLAVDKGYLEEDDLQAGSSVPVGTESSGAAEGTAGTGTEGQEEIDNAVLLTISSDNSKKSGELKKELRDIAARELDTDKIDSEILVGEASMEQRNEAKELGVTPGKLALIENAIETEPELQLEELKRNSVKELLRKIRENEKKKQEKTNPGAKSGAYEQSTQNQASEKNQDYSIQTENTAAGKNPDKAENPGSGKPNKDKQKSGNNVQPQSGEQTVQGAETATDGGISAQINGLLKDRGQNKTGKNDSQHKNQSGNINKGLNESTGSIREGKNRNEAANKGKQSNSRIGGGSSGKIDEADRKAVGKGANELKLQREKLRNDLLDQMEKQLKERKNKSNGKNTIEGNNVNGGKTNVNNNSIKR